MPSPAKRKRCRTKRRATTATSRKSKTLNWSVWGLPAPVNEFRFHPIRRWRFDHCWPDWLLAIEQDGGLFIRGGHSRGAGRLNDYEKDREAMKMGWYVGRFSPQQVRDGVAAQWIREMRGMG
jgi:very-short-patch-repair endonuclease